MVFDDFKIALYILDKNSYGLVNQNLPLVSSGVGPDNCSNFFSFSRTFTDFHRVLGEPKYSLSN